MSPLKFKGNRVYVTRSKLNEGATQRLNKHIAIGWYAHESTSGDVEVYVLGESCPFRKRDVTKEELGIGQLCNELASMAAKREFEQFCQGVDELAYLYKQLGLQSIDFVEAMRRVESKASAISGNQMLPYEIRQHLEMARQKRTGTLLFV